VRLALGLAGYRWALPRISGVSSYEAVSLVAGRRGVSAVDARLLLGVVRPVSFTHIIVVVVVFVAADVYNNVTRPATVLSNRI